MFILGTIVSRDLRTSMVGVRNIDAYEVSQYKQNGLVGSFYTRQALVFFYNFNEHYKF